MRRTEICPTAAGHTSMSGSEDWCAQVLKLTVFSKFGFFLSFANFVFFFHFNDVACRQDLVVLCWMRFFVEGWGCVSRTVATKLTLFLQQKETARCVSKKMLHCLRFMLSLRQQLHVSSRRHARILWVWGDVKTRVVLRCHLGEGVSFGFDGIVSNTPDTRQWSPTLFSFLVGVSAWSCFCWKYTHKHCTYSAVQSLHKRVWLKNCTTSLCTWKESVIWSAHVSPFVALSPAVCHEHIIFLIRCSFYHYTSTRSTIGTTRSTPRTPSTSSTSPSSPIREAAPSRTTLAWKPAEWRKPAQNILHRLWAQRACDCLKDRQINRSISIMWRTERIGRTRSSSSYHRRSGGIWRDWGGWLTGF